MDAARIEKLGGNPDTAKVEKLSAGVTFIIQDYGRTLENHASTPGWCFADVHG